MSDSNERTRRRVLQVTGAVAAAGLAGCGGDGGDGTPTPGALPGSDYPAIDEWLTETQVGQSDDTYDGNVLDLRDRDEVQVAVGAAGNGGNFAFGPSAIAVSTGTTVRWVWTGEGGLHNVVASAADQIGETDFEFSSGDPVSTEGEEFTQTFDGTGVALYRCEPHLSLGMKGGVAVE